MSQLDINSERIRQAATCLSNRILDFQAYLRTLPGKVDHQHNTTTINLRFCRSGHSWILKCKHPDDLEFKELSEASVKMKLESVHLFPEFLATMQQSQEVFISNISNTVTAFDSFFDSLKSHNK